eukprot:TRINITY_DN104_c0_g1_i1.p1 TRINITY_DN104_c0_g1~~TRINITY_DN104_c0_g1_i1.p1  ORF type:complete len:1548 (+),score=502.27 TRINITY_DN104_c0_g1_i1:107-4750(+)
MGGDDDDIALHTKSDDSNNQPSVAMTTGGASASTHNTATSAPSIISAQNASLGRSGAGMSRAALHNVRTQSKANLQAGGLPTKASKAVLNVGNDQDAAAAASKLTDQDIRDGAELGDIDSASIWEHTLVDLVQDGDSEVPNFAALEQCKNGKKYNWSVKDGLTTENATTSLAEFGENRLTPPEKLPEWLKFILHLVGGFSLLLWAGSILCFAVFAINGIADNLYLGIVLAAVVTGTGIFSYMQEAKADATMDAFANMAPEQVYCRRNGQSWSDVNDKIDAALLVPGDLVKVQLGDKIPADLIMISVEDFKVNNSSLTGEPEPLERMPFCTDPDVMETKNVAFFGTFCEQGNCEGLVIRTGDTTRMGQIAAETSKDEGSETLMQMEIRHFIHIVSGCAGVIGITFFIIAVPTYGIVDAVVFMIGIIVANVPEGLLATVTVALTLTARTMAVHQVLVKNMETIETLGSITTIASDKTGTLTQNRMSANHAVYDFQLKAVDAQLVAGEKSGIAFSSSDPTFDALQRCAGLCGSAKFQTFDEKYSNPNNWESRSGAGDQGTEAQERDYEKYFHYVPHDADNTAIPWKEIKNRGPEDKSAVRLHPDESKGETLRWRNSDSAFRPYKDGNATDAGLMKFGEARVHEQYETLARSLTDDKGAQTEASKAVMQVGLEESGSYVCKFRKNWPTIAQIPFNSSNKFMVTVHEVPSKSVDQLGERARLLESAGFDADDQDDFIVLMMKGAAEKVAGKCCTALVDGKPCSPRVYYSMQNGKLSTQDDLVKAKHNPMDIEETLDAGKLLERRRAFNIQQSIDEKDICDNAGGISAGEWDGVVAKSVVGDDIVKSSTEAADTMTGLMGSIQANTLKYHQSSLAVEGERVLAFAHLVARKSQLIQDKVLVPSASGKGFDLTHEDADTATKLGFDNDHVGASYAWTYLGMISLVDPPRDAVPAAVESCREASIQVVMVTGDHPLTAKSIATRIKIIQGDTWREFERENRIQRGEDPDLITEKEMFDSYQHHEWFGLRQRFKKVKGLAIFGPTIHKFQDDDWRYALRMKELVFARTQPEQKKEIVGRMKDLHELNLDALDQLVACHHMIAKEPERLKEIHNELAIKFDEVDKQTEQAKDDFIQKCIEKGQKTNGKDFEAGIEKAAEEGRKEKAARADKYLVKEGHTFRQMTYLMLPIRAIEMFHKLNGKAADPVRGIAGAEGQDPEALLTEITALIVREEARNNQPKVVAVTGDGVNDSPALKAADCGIAMGIAGADVAKENADMILLDDNFASIVQGIEQGRLIFDNLKKSIAYTLTSNIPEITPFLALIILQIPIPLETVMILTIDLGTDMLPAIALAYEEPEGGIMRRAPRDKSKDRLVNSKLIGIAYGQIGMIQAASGFACYFLVFDHFGLGYSDIAGEGFDYIDSDVLLVAGLDYDTRIDILRKAQTAFLVSIIVAQWADVIICKTRERSIFEQKMTNMVLNIGLLEETLLAIALVYVPPLNDAFKTTNIDFKMWCYGLPFSFLIWVYDEIRKYMIRRERAGNDEWPEGKGIVERWTYY